MIQLFINHTSLRVMRRGDEIVWQWFGHVLVDIGVLWIKDITLWAKEITSESLKNNVM